MIDTEGLATTVTAELVFKPVDGAQLYERAAAVVYEGLAESTAVEPWQKAAGPETLTSGLVVSVMTPVLVQVPSVSSTVYVVDVVGLAITLALLVVFNPVAGNQL